MKNVDNYIKKEKILMDLEYRFIEDLVDLRKNNHLTQQELANRANLIRETIARIESKMTSPQINTIIKILEPLGYTISIKKSR